MSDDSLFLKASRRASRSKDAEARDAEARAEAERAEAERAEAERAEAERAEAERAEAERDQARAGGDRDRPARPGLAEPVEPPDLGFDLGFDLGNLDPGQRPSTPQGPLAFGGTDLPDPIDALAAGMPTGRRTDALDDLLGDLPDLRPGNAPRPPGGPRDAELYASGTISPPGSVGGNKQPVQPDRVSTSSDDRGNSVSVTEFSNRKNFEPGMPSVSGTTTVTTGPDGSTSTVVVESMLGDGSIPIVSARDDGTTRTETWFNPDGTVNGSNSTTVERSERGTTTTTTWRDGGGAVTGSKTVTVDPMGSITTKTTDRYGNETRTVTDLDGNPISSSEQGDYPSSGSESTSGTGTTDDDSDNEPADDTESETPVETGDSGEGVARTNDEPGADVFGIDTSNVRAAASTTAAGTTVDGRNTNTGNPDHQHDGPTLDPSTLPPDGSTGPADDPRGDDPAGNTGFGAAPDPSRLGAVTTTATGTTVDGRNTNTGNPDHQPDGPTLDPSTLPPDDGTGGGIGGGGTYQGLTPDQTGDSPNLDQGLGLDRGLSVNLGDPYDLSDLDLTGTGTDDDQLITTGLDADLDAVGDMSRFLDADWTTAQPEFQIDAGSWNLEPDGETPPD